ncbi:hypothetical protein DL96DRAFT_1716315 [Flagelloscypha sp. PMI_526]|nr:hypothetical protein DL96DRAFT_1716315 [Flagelloscypha sp. PMI_526]
MKSLYNGSFVGICQHHSELIGQKDPFYWELVRCEDGYQFRSPDTGALLVLGLSTNLLFPNSAKVYILDNIPENIESIQTDQVMQEKPNPIPGTTRIRMNWDSSFADASKFGQPPTFDRNGKPLYFASLIHESQVIPGKAGDHLHRKVGAPLRGKELTGPQFDILPFDPTTMELVPSSNGIIPGGRRPIEGGYEANGTTYHALVHVDGVYLPGKFHEHSHGAHASSNGKEHYRLENYKLLVWK